MFILKMFPLIETQMFCCRLLLPVIFLSLTLSDVSFRTALARFRQAQLEEGKVKVSLDFSFFLLFSHDDAGRLRQRQQDNQMLFIILRNVYTF